MEVQTELSTNDGECYESCPLFNNLHFFFLWKVFHCVHFECPANQKEPSICGSDRTDSSEQSVLSADTTISSIM